MPVIHLTNFIPDNADKLYGKALNIAVWDKFARKINEEFKAVAGSEILKNGDSFTLSVTVGKKKLFGTFRVITSENPKSIIAEQVKGDFVHFRYEQYFKQIVNGTILIDIIDFGYPSGFFTRLFTGFSLRKRINAIFSDRVNLIFAKSDAEVGVM